MSTLEIKKGELICYKNMSNYGIRNKIEVINNDLNNYSRYSHHLINIINNNREQLQSDFSSCFSDTFFQEISESNIKEKVSYIQNLISRFTPQKGILKKIIINEGITEGNENNDFIKEFIFTSNIKKVINGAVKISNFRQESIFSNFIIKGDLTIVSLLSNLSISDMEVSGIFIISNFGGKSLDFQKCKFGNLDFSKGKGIIDDIQFSTCTGNINISNLEIKKLSINNSEFSLVELNNNTFENRVKISSEGENILKKRIERLEFIDNNIKGGLRIGHLNFGDIKIYNLKNLQNNEINIGNINVDYFIFSNIRNLGKIRFYNINFGEKNNKYKLIDINNSSFGDSEFQNINLNSFKKVKIYDTLFSGLNYTGVQWAYRISADKESNYGKLRNSYRVLKDIAEKNNDNVTALRFYSEEMRVHSKYLKNKKGATIDRLIMFFNHYTSNFGLDFVLPILWIILINALIILVVMISSDNYGFTSFNPDNFYSFLGYYSNSFNITNDYSEIFGINLKKEQGGLNILIVIKNVIYGALIYQAVLAFRKFSRKV